MQRIRALIAETGETGFHLVDEAAPPAGMRALAKRLIAEKLSITWWGNIRFEKTFTPELCPLLAEAGCVAVSGGLEVASNRLLELMKKGVTVEQVARVTRAFTDAGIMVHAYLMYGFPTETEQDTIDALERVRQLFAAGCIQSAYWHRFAATAHSPIGLHPGEIRHHAAAAARTSRSRTTTWSSTTRPARITTISALACARRSTTTCTASASKTTCACGSSRAPASERATAGARPPCHARRCRRT